MDPQGIPTSLAPGHSLPIPRANSVFWPEGDSVSPSCHPGLGALALLSHTWTSQPPWTSAHITYHIFHISRPFAASGPLHLLCPRLPGLCWAPFFVAFTSQLEVPLIRESCLTHLAIYNVSGCSFMSLGSFKKSSSVGLVQIH